MTDFTNRGFGFPALDFEFWISSFPAFPIEEDVLKRRDARQNAQCKSQLNHREILTLKSMFEEMPSDRR